MKVEKTIYTKEGVFHIVWQSSPVKGVKIVKAEIDDETGELRVYSDCKIGRKKRRGKKCGYKLKNI